MNHEVAKSLAEQELSNAKAIGYPTLLGIVDDEPTTRTVIGPDGNEYQIEVCVFWDTTKNGAIRVIVAIDDGGWRVLAPLSVSDLVFPTAES
jgi:hypothetical protein